MLGTQALSCFHCLPCGLKRQYMAGARVCQTMVNEPLFNNIVALVTIITSVLVGMETVDTLEP